MNVGSYDYFKRRTGVISNVLLSSELDSATNFKDVGTTQEQWSYTADNQTYVHGIIVSWKDSLDHLKLAKLFNGTGAGLPDFDLEINGVNLFPNSSRSIRFLGQGWKHSIQIFDDGNYNHVLKLEFDIPHSLPGGTKISCQLKGLFTGLSYAYILSLIHI